MTLASPGLFSATCVACSSPDLACVTAIKVVVKIYNNLVSYKTQYQNGFEQISVQLKRRLDLIGNLVDAAKKYEH
jgi:hypothetical protein